VVNVKCVIHTGQYSDVPDRSVLRPTALSGLASASALGRSQCLVQP
jgi:hypothetical protein